jgi:repressor LexA
MGRRSRKEAEQIREQIFEFVRRRVLEGWPPTVREVQAAAGYRAVQSANAHLRALVEQGRLVKLAGKARGYALPDSPRGVQPTVLVPLLGRVQAGVPTLAVEEPEGFVPVEMRRSLSKTRIEALLALRVRGDSMTGAGIQDGDLVVVQRQPTAHDGDIVVALVDDEATVKRLRIRKQSVELVAENPAFDPIVVRPDRVALIGKVIEIRRYLDDFRRPPLRRGA